MDSFIDFYVGMLEGLINAYRILLAIEEGKKTVKLYVKKENKNERNSKKRS